MAFNTKEQEIIKWGLQNGKSKQEVEKAISNYRLGVVPQSEPVVEQPQQMKEVQPTIGQLTGEEQLAGGQKIVESITRASEKYNEYKPEQVFKRTGALLEGALGATSGAAQTIFAPISATIRSLQNKVENDTNFQKFASSEPVAKALDVVNSSIEPIKKLAEENPEVARNMMDGLNVFLTALGSGVPKQLKVPMGQAVTDVIGGIKSDVVSGAKTFTQGVKNTTESIAGATNKAISPTLKNIQADVLPTADRIVNSQVVKALDFNASDVSKIEQSTGNNPGRYIADNNLIGSNKAETIANLERNFKTNYDAVRAEISKVKDAFPVREVPAYTTALREIDSVIKDVPGLTKQSVEVMNLLDEAKTGANITLDKVQRVKELLDEHFNLYKATGDVKAGATKEGLANLRSDIKTFIERKVKQTTGADISVMNNNVATSKGILDTIETRSTKGLTSSNIKLGDLGVFGVGTAVGTPLLGTALVFAKKVLESPTVMLRLSKFLDGLSDARRLKIQKELEAGNVPKELQSLLPKSSKVENISKNPSTNVDTNLKNVSIGETISPKQTKVKSNKSGLKNKQGGMINPNKMFDDAMEFLDKQFSPEKVASAAKLIDSEDFKIINGYLTNPTMDNIRRVDNIIKGMGIEKLSMSEQDEFLKLALDKYRQSSPSVKLKVKSEKKGSPTMGKLEQEARKYKSAEEFIDSKFSSFGRIKTKEIDNMYMSIPDGTTSPINGYFKGFFMKKGDKIFPSNKATPEILKTNGIELNKDGSVKEGIFVNRINFTEDIISKSQLIDIWNKANKK